MTKRIVALFMLIAVCASFVSCGGKGAPDVKAPEEKIVNVEDYINKEIAYFMPNMEYAMEAIMDEGLSRDEAFNEFVASWEGYAKLPDELVNSYKDLILANNEGMGEDEAKKLAETLIKEEIVVAMAFRTLCGNSAITDEVRAAAAEDFGLADVTVVGSETYALDAFIKQQAIAAYLNGEKSCYGISFEEAASEESSEDAASEDSSEDAVSEESSEDAASEDSSEDAVSEDSSEDAVYEESSEEAVYEESSEDASSEDSASE